MSLQPVTNVVKSRIARRIVLTGCVQGIGLRPAVVRLASECRVGGSVANDLSGVQITVEGADDDVTEFLQRLPDSLPEAADVRETAVFEIIPDGQTRFAIQAAVAHDGAMATPVPRDVAVCEECLADIATQGNRRSNYPLTTCTKCGPRISIVTAMPFERPQTEMSQFPLCAECRAEYQNPHDRRFHAQTMSCPTCGPQVWVTDATSTVVAERGSAVKHVVACLRAGGIVALRGIGGYQLLCDATDDTAVNRLRQLKRRRTKPFAVMVATVDATRRLAEVDHPAREALLSPANPIVLLPVKSGNGLAASIHPGLKTLGVMLPTTPLHWLILRDCDRPLVVTSGNLEGRPLEVTPESAQTALRGIADLWLHHDRPIRHALDDSVVRIIAGRPVTFRLARGMAPLPLSIATSGMPDIIATGGHQKSALALSNGGQAFLGPHIGDLDGIETRERYVQHVSQLTELYRMQSKLWVHDLHPDYFTTQWAQTQSGRHIAVQHHHAHIVAAMLEQGWLDREVLGVAFDGTGYGPDGTIWGGEFLRATVRGFHRVAHLQTFSLIGGDAAVREPLRVAIALAHQSVRSEDRDCGLNSSELEAALRLRPLLEHGRLSIQTSSAGRLFDGVAALVLGVETAEFEGYPAQLLEAVCDLSESGSYSLPLIGESGKVAATFSRRATTKRGIDISTSDNVPANDDETIVIDWRPMIREILSDRAQGVSPGTMAMRFHRGLARAIVAVCGRLPHLPIVLGGGVFQNRLLVELIVENHQRQSQPLGLPGLIPPNDGGLAAGQLAVGLAGGHFMLSGF